jgi:GAF domain-containing protein
MNQLPSNAETDPPTGEHNEGTDGTDHLLRAEFFHLDGLARGTHGLAELLELVARFAVDSIPGADGAGVTLLTGDRSDRPIEVTASSNDLVAQIEHIQYEMVQEGPCITAMEERRTVRSGSLGGEKEWPRFGPRVSRLGIHSTLAIPLVLPKQVVGAINVYARAKHAFSDHAMGLATQFAQPAAVAVHNAQLLARALELAGQLQRALESRPIIDRAVGVLMARRGYTSRQAFDQLRAISQREHRKLSQVAAQLVEEAGRKTRGSASSSRSEPFVSDDRAGG